MTKDQPADARGMIIMHRMFQREIGQAPALIRGVAAGDVERAEIVADHVALVADILFHHHHAEDTHLWPLPRARASAEVEPIFRAMEGQHEEIERLSAEMGARLARVADHCRRTAGGARPRGGTPVVRAPGTRAAGGAGRAASGREAHDEAEQQAMVTSDADDVTPERIPLIFGLMAYDGEPDVVREAIAHMPPEIAPVMLDIAGKAFAEHSLRVHGTATPPHVTANRPQ
jgi:hypothetical protein